MLGLLQGRLGLVLEEGWALDWVEGQIGECNTVDPWHAHEEMWNDSASQVFVGDIRCKLEAGVFLIANSGD